MAECYHDVLSNQAYLITYLKYLKYVVQALAETATIFFKTVIDGVLIVYFNSPLNQRFTVYILMLLKFFELALLER